jgi:hypothetical protein
MTSATPGTRPSLYVAFEQVEHKRDQRTLDRYKEVPDEPGLAHALDARNTSEGDPWWRQERLAKGRFVRREPKFYSGDGPRAACGQRVLACVPLEFNPEDPDCCPECAELARAGKAIGRWEPRSYESWFCGAYLSLKTDGVVNVLECRLRQGHDGNHRSPGGEWLRGEEDFVPPPDGYV